MWASLYEGLRGKVYWYLCFSEEKGQLKADLSHALETYRTIQKYPYDDAQEQHRMMSVLMCIIRTFTKRINELETGNANELGIANCPYKAFVDMHWHSYTDS